MGKTSQQTALLRFNTGVTCAQFCLPSNSRWYVSMYLSFAPAALGCTIGGSALPWAPQLGSEKTKGKQGRGSWRHQRAGQIPAVLKSGWGTRTLLRGAGLGRGGRDSDPCSPCQSTGGCFSLSNRWVLTLEQRNKLRY